jgi:hypothetical protein
MTDPCATAPEDLLALADAIEKARCDYLDAIGDGPDEWLKMRTLAGILWNDKGTFAPALRQAAECADLRQQIDIATKALEAIAHAIVPKDTGGGRT